MKVPGRLMVAVYFDNSVIRPVADAGAGIASHAAVASRNIAVPLEPRVDALSDADAFSRQSAAAAWWRGAIQRDDNLTDLRDYLRPYLTVDHIAVEPWMRFWLVEADAA